MYCFRALLFFQSLFTLGHAASVPITLVGLNDLHGTIETTEVKLGPARIPMHIGGLALMGGYFDILRADNPDGVLILDSGDIYQGSLLSNHFQGRAIVESYNALGVDASTFGNHEFDFGYVKGTKQGDPQGALRRLVERAQFRILSANVLRDDQVFPGALPSRLFTRNGVKIGVIGLTTRTTPSQAVPRFLVGVSFAPMPEAVVREAARLRDLGAHVVVVIAHAGGKCDLTLPSTAGDVACASSPQDEVTTLLEALPKGTIDVVMAGHTHFAQAHWIRGVPVVQTTGFGQSFSTVRLQVDPARPRGAAVLSAEISHPTFFCPSHFERFQNCDPQASFPFEPGAMKPATFLGRRVQPREDLLAVLAPYQQEVADLKRRPLFTLDTDLSHDRSAESRLGDCFSDLILRASGSPLDSSLFMSISGGFRAALAQGEIRYGDLFRVMPFDGGLVEVRLDGDELSRFAASLSTSPKSVATFSEGWKILLDAKPVFPRFRGLRTPEGKPPVAGASYNLVTDEFNVLAGGPGEVIFGRHHLDGSLRVIAPNLRDFLAETFAPNRVNHHLPRSCAPEAKPDRTVWVDDSGRPL